MPITLYKTLRDFGGPGVDVQRELVVEDDALIQRDDGQQTARIEISPFTREQWIRSFLDNGFKKVEP